MNQLDFVVSLGLAAGTSEAKVAGAKGFRKMGSAHLPGTCLHLLNILSDILLSSNLETVQLLNNPFNNLVLSNSFSFLFLLQVFIMGTNLHLCSFDINISMHKFFAIILF